MRCSAEVAPVRAGPFEESEQVTQALRGEPLSAEERRVGWVRVRTAYGYEGWVSDLALEEGEGHFPDPVAQSPLELARTYLGSPYVWGGLSARGIDCSGLVHLSYRLTGRLIPRDAWQQEGAGLPIAETEALPGDLISYGAGARADHIAFWVGTEKILHATARAGLGVVEERELATLRSRRRVIVRL
jgi:cell wall-associated NlpC family hydrolase